MVNSSTQTDRSGGHEAPAPSWLRLLVTRFTLRHWRREPRHHAMLVLLLALGVGLVVAIRLANRAALSGFSQFTATLTGSSDWVVEPAAGRLPLSALPEMRAALAGDPVHLVPVLELSATPPTDPADSTPRFGRASYTLLGLDIVALANLARDWDRGLFDQRRETGADGSSPDAFWKLLTGEPQVWVSSDFAVEPPSFIELVIDERAIRVGVAGVIPTVPNSPRPPASLLLIDLAHLQRLAGKEGMVDRVEVIVEPGAASDTVRERSRARLAALGGEGERWDVRAPGARRETAEQMTRAFRLNLTVLSLIALLVGGYLVFQALDGAVVRRRSEIAILRSLGVNASALQRAWLAEAAVLGLVGSLAGVLLGWAGAQVSVRAVGTTVNALYYATTVTAAHLTAGEAALGLMIGLGTALFAGWIPARDAARTPPAQLLTRGTPAPRVLRLRILLLATAALLATATVLAHLPPLRLAAGARLPLGGYAAALAAIAGAGLGAGLLLPAFARLLRSAGAAAAPLRIALGHLRRPSPRHRLAVAALVCAIGMTAGMAILVSSFEFTIRGWIARTLDSDLYLSSSGAQSASARNRISAGAAEAIRAHPAVLRARALVAVPARIGGLPTLVSGTELAALRGDAPGRWLSPPSSPAFYDAARNAGLVAVSEALAERLRLRPGDSLRLPTLAGPVDVEVAAIYSDYGNDRGTVLAEREHVARWFDVTDVTNLALDLRPDARVETVAADLRASYPGLTILPNASLRAEVLRIFRQTFSITYALEVIGIAVAVAGLGLTLASVLLDRRDELATLRALGMSRHEIALATMAEGALLGAVATAAGLALSLGLGWLLIHVINKQSFGWTLGQALPSLQLGLLAALVIAAATGVGYGVGRWGAKLPADREE
jgi:putative ABC transport system permease protein